MANRKKSFISFMVSCVTSYKKFNSVDIFLGEVIFRNV